MLVFSWNFISEINMVQDGSFYYKTGTMGRIGSTSYVLPIQLSYRTLNRVIRVLCEMAPCSRAIKNWSQYVGLFEVCKIGTIKVFPFAKPCHRNLLSTAILIYFQQDFFY